MAVRLISAFWAQKRLIPIEKFSIEKFSSRWFERVIHDVRPVHVKFSSRLLEQPNGC